MSLKLSNHGVGDSVRNNKMARRLIVVPKQKNDMSMFDRNIWGTRRGNGGGLPERTQPHACDGDEG